MKRLVFNESTGYWEAPKSVWNGSFWEVKAIEQDEHPIFKLMPRKPVMKDTFQGHYKGLKFKR